MQLEYTTGVCEVSECVAVCVYSVSVTCKMGQHFCALSALSQSTPVSAAAVREEQSKSGCNEKEKCASVILFLSASPPAILS